MPYTDSKYNLEVTEVLLFGLKRIMTLFGRGSQENGLDNLTTGDINLGPRNRYSSISSTLRISIVWVFGWVLVGPVKKMVGGFVETVDVLVEVLVIR